VLVDHGKGRLDLVEISTEMKEGTSHVVRLSGMAESAHIVFPNFLAVSVKIPAKT